MSLAFYPFYAERFEAATTHLSMLEDGAFNRLLRLCWRSPGCKVPDDKGWIYRQMRAGNAAEKAAIDRVLAEFFKRGKGKIWNAKLLEIHAQVSAAHLNKSEAGKRGAAAKALKRNKTDTSTAEATLKQPEPEPKEEKREANASQKKTRGSRLSADWFLPVEWGEWALGEGLTRDEIRAEADKFRDYWLARAGPQGVKLDWQATWRNWIRTAKERVYANRNSGRIPQGGQRVNPALDQIARLSGIGAAPGDGGIRVGSPGEEIGSLWVGTRPQ